MTATKHNGSSTKSRDMGRQPEPPNLSTFNGRVGALLQEHRNRRKLSVAELRDRLKAEGYQASEFTIYTWERGRGSVPVAALPYLAAALKTTVRKLLPDE